MNGTLFLPLLTVALILGLDHIGCLLDWWES